MATLDASFESDLREQLLDEIAERLKDDDSAVHEAIERSEAALRAYASQHDYDVGAVLDSLEGPTITRRSGAVRVEWGWTHRAARFFEWGTSAHSVDGNPTLSFVWVDPPPEIAAQFEDEGAGVRVFFSGVNVEGLPEARFNREGAYWLQHELRTEGV